MLIENVAMWGRDKKLYDPIMQALKMYEEAGEIAHELTRNRINSLEIQDALGDTAVCLIILADILGYDIMDCLEMAYDEIKGRKGSTINNSFIKDI